MDERKYFNDSLEPYVFKVRFDNKAKSYYLEYDKIKYDLPQKPYGKMLARITHYWTTFDTGVESLGVLLTGDSGSGKTTLAEGLANVALYFGLPIIIVSEIKADLELVNFLAELDKVVIMFDEFGKVFDTNLQNKMLSMFSDVLSKKKLYIITENSKRMISNLLLNRPGRAMYHADFERLEEKVLLEYCVDREVSEEFLTSIKLKYAESLIFSFDHMRALVKEHKLYPELTFDEVLDYLNLEILKRKLILYVVGVINEATGEPLEFETRGSEVLKSNFIKGYDIWVEIKEPYTRLHVNNKKIIRIDATSATCKTGEYIVELEFK